MGFYFWLGSCWFFLSWVGFYLKWLLGVFGVDLYAFWCVFWFFFFLDFFGPWFRSIVISSRCLSFRCPRKIKSVFSLSRRLSWALGSLKSRSCWVGNLFPCNSMWGFDDYTVGSNVAAEITFFWCMNARSSWIWLPLW